MEALLPSSISPKISTILQSHVYPRFGRVLRALARAKSALLDALGRTKWGARRRRRKPHTAIGCGSSKKKRTSRHQTAVTSSGVGFAKRPPHLTWSGGLSPARTAAEAALDVNYHVYPCHDSAWSAVVVPVAALGGIEGGTAAAAAAAGEYCGYLRWLEEEMPDEVVVVEGDDEGEEDADDAGDGGNEIDRLAEQFIARCRANFLLEKQESYDRCQEMIARSL